jgi:hypothetical protein
MTQTTPIAREFTSWLRDNIDNLDNDKFRSLMKTHTLVGIQVGGSAYNYVVPVGLITCAEIKKLVISLNGSIPSFTPGEKFIYAAENGMLPKNLDGYVCVTTVDTRSNRLTRSIVYVNALNVHLYNKKFANVSQCM